MMTLGRWLTALLFLAAFWAVGWWWLRPRLEQSVADRAWSVLNSDPALQRRVSAVRIEPAGQTLSLRGEVRSSADRRAVRELVGAGVRVSVMGGWLGSGDWNPVAAVVDDLDVVPLPAGWAALNVRGRDAMLLTIAATDAEAVAWEGLAQDRWRAAAGKIKTSVLVDADRFDETSDLNATLEGLKRVAEHADGDGGLWVARLGKGWQRVDLSGSEAAVRARVMELGVSAVDWEKVLQAEVSGTRVAYQRALAARKERERLAALPPGHVFLAARGDKLMLRGAVGSKEEKNSLLANVLAAFPARRIIEEVRVDAGRRPFGGFGVLSEDFLADHAAHGKTFALGLPGQEWIPTDWEVGRDAQPWKTSLPKELTSAMVQEDSAALIDWLQGASATFPDFPAPAPIPFFTLTLFDGKAVVGGTVAEEAVRAQVVAAVRRVYSAGWVVEDQVRVDGTTGNAGAVFHTVRSLPRPPGLGESWLVAFARPGEEWRSVPVTVEFLEPGGVVRTDLVPPDMPAGAVVESLEDVIERMRAWRTAELKSKPAEVKGSDE